MNRTVLLLFVICSLVLMSILAEPHKRHRRTSRSHRHRRPTNRCPAIKRVTVPRKVKCSRAVDVFIVLDGSGSIGICNFVKVKHFLGTVLAQLHISSGAVRVGLMQFSTQRRLKIEFNLKRYKSRTAVVRAVERVPYMNGRATALGSALQVTRRVLANRRYGVRPGVPKVVVVVTDGLPFRDGANALAEAKALQSQVERILVVGFGRKLNSRSFSGLLKKIAYPVENVLQVSDIKKFVEVLNPIRQDICKPPTGRCSATGDPHYRTFDGKRYNFMGKCQYYLVKHKYFKVLQNNEPCAWNKKVTCTQTITFKGKGYTITVKRGGFVTVNGARFFRRSLLRRRGIQIIRKGKQVTIKVNFGLTVGYNGVYNVFVELAGKYKNTVSGLCGNFNGRPTDDLRGKEPATFGNLWKVQKSCPNVCDVENPCGRGRLPSVAQQCSQRLQGSPLNKCKYTINPRDYIENCKYDVCACKGNPQACLCQALAAYIEDCTARGITGLTLRSFRMCNLPCSSAPCLNAGFCKNFGGTKYKCFCQRGYGGCRCEGRI